MNKYSDKRNLVYWSKLYLTSLLRGDEYEEAQKTIKMAKKLLTLGVEITEIENVTGISKEELLKLK